MNCPMRMYFSLLSLLVMSNIVMSQPIFNTSFSPDQIGPGSISTISYTINNPSSVSVEDLDFTNILPVGLLVASPPIITNSCSGGIVTAVAGTSVISFTDGFLSSGSNCIITVNVTSSTIGTSTNTTGDLTSDIGNSGPATANLTIANDRPGFLKSFNPAIINFGEESTLTLTIDNTATGNPMTFLSFTDNLPVGLKIAAIPNMTNSCTGTGNLIAVPGTSSISYTTTSFFDEEVAAGATCAFTVSVVAENTGTLDNITEDLSCRNNLFQFFNAGKATASIEVLTPPLIAIQKDFSTNPVTPGGTTDLTFTINNFDRTNSATNLMFTDDLDAMLNGAVAVGAPVIDACGIGSVLSGTNLLTFSGGSLPPEGSCTITIPVSIPVAAAPGEYTNVTSTISGDLGGTPITGNTFTEKLFVEETPLFTKTFLDNPITAGSTTTVEFTITNTSSTSSLTDMTFLHKILEEILIFQCQVRIFHLQDHVHLQ